MTSQLIAGRLWWKETRQLVPLLAMLIAMAAFLHVTFLASGISANHNLMYEVSCMALLVGLPGLFAVGAGALLIGQEKELRTLGWLNSLPVDPKLLLKTKLLICCAGLGATWIASFLLASITSLSISQDAFSCTWLLHTLFLLLVGIGLAWRMQSSFSGLLLLVPIALLPGICAYLLSWLTGQQGNPPHETNNPNILLGCQTVFCAAALVWGWRAGQTALGPARPQKVHSTPMASDNKTILLGAPHPPASALIWQAASQSRTVLIGCTTMIVLSTLWMAATIAWIAATFSTAIPLACLFFAISWLGVCAFQSDGHLSRIRFLADRGISPRAVWLSRQAVPAAIAGLGTILATLTLLLITSNGNASTKTIQIACVCALAFTGTAYSISQWIAQATRSPIVGAIAGPAMSIGGLVYLGCSLTTFGTPLWLLALCGVLPLATSYFLTRRWMDVRRDRTFWIAQIATLAAIILIPLSPLAVTYATLPRLDAQITEKLNELSKASEYRMRIPRADIVLKGEYQERLANEIEISPADAQDAAPRHQQELASLQHQVESHDGPIRLDYRVLPYIQSEILLSRMHLDTSSEADPQLRERYNQWLRLTRTLVKHLRLSPHISDQDTADRLEVLQMQQLLADAKKPFIEQSTKTGLISQLAQRNLRRQARLQAIATSWRQNQYGFRYTSIERFQSQRPTTSNLRAQASYQRQTKLMLQNLWKLAKNSSSTEVTAALATYWDAPPAIYGQGTNSKYFRAEDLETHPLPRLRHYPGSQWNAAWERQAELLASQN